MITQFYMKFQNMMDMIFNQLDFRGNPQNSYLEDINMGHNGSLE